MHDLCNNTYKFKWLGNVKENKIIIIVCFTLKIQEIRNSSPFRQKTSVLIFEKPKKYLTKTILYYFINFSLGGVKFGRVPPPVRRLCSFRFLEVQEVFNQN